MKKLLCTLILGAWFLLPNLNAQTYLGDTLRIMNNGQISAKIVHTDIHKLKENKIYKDLILSFQNNLKSVKDQIPDYPNYKMIYEKDINLRIDEITGVSKFKMIDGKKAISYSTNTAILNSNNLRIELYFNEIDELLEPEYMVTIEDAIEKIIYKKSKLSRFWSRSIFDNYSYTNDTKELTKGDASKPKGGRTRVGLIINPSIGVYKNDPIYSYSLGLGIKLNNESLAYVFSETSYQYDKALDEMKSASLLGIAFKPTKEGGLHIAFPLSNNKLYDDLKFQAGLTVYSVKGLSLRTNFNYLKTEGGAKFMPSFNVGYSF